MGSLFKAALPIIGSLVAPGIGTALGSALSGATLSAIGGGLGGLASGGGLKSAALGAAGGYLGGGGLGSPSTTVNWAANPAAGLGASTQTLSGSGLLGALSSAAPGAANTIYKGVGAAANAGGGLGGKLMSGSGLGNIYSTYSARENADDLAKAQSAYTSKALELQNPFYASGLSANTRLSALLGLDPNSDEDDILNGLRETPGYKFRMEQGTDAMNKSLAARGGLFSGQALKDAQSLGQGLADQTYNDYVAQLMGQQGVGANAAGVMGGLNQDLGNIQANRLSAKNDAMNKGLAGLLSGDYGFAPQEEDPTKALLKRLGYA